MGHHTLSTRDPNTCREGNMCEMKYIGLIGEMGIKTNVVGCIYHSSKSSVA